jgi:hypothetical protein
MDEHMNYKRVKTTSKMMLKLQHIIEKPETQLCLFEVPRGVRINLTIVCFFVGGFERSIAGV